MRIRSSSLPSRLAPAALVLALTAASADGQAPGSVRIRGIARSAADSAPLARVAVATAGVESREEAVTGASGAFALELPTLPSRLVAARLGFAPETLVVTRADAVLDLYLRPAALTLSPLLVRAERAATTASSSVVRALDIALRPRESSQELLRLAPGLVIAQHAGGGKAEQLFLRGFDADHGTDVAITVDGIPVNMPTHAHGQGYADLHFLMPEVVELVEVRKGPFDVRDGDFATAGAVSIQTRERIAAPAVGARAGSFDTRHLVALLPIGGDASRAGGYVAASAHLSDGPFLTSQDYRRANLFGRWTAPVGDDAEVVALVSGFDSRWDASGQVPDRAVRDGRLSRFGAVDASEGGTTSRHDLSLGLRSRTAGSTSWAVRAWATRYRFDLFSNFTFFLVDSLNGDGIEQVDDRMSYGAHASWERAVSLGGRPGRWSVGVGSRGDDGDVALHRHRARTRLGTLVDAHSRQLHLAQWARLDLAISPRVHADVGLRADAFRFSVRDRLGSEEIGGIPHGSGTRWQAVASPRLNLAFDATGATRLFASAGTGFHSNDGRDAILAAPGGRILPRALSAELGVRHSWTGGTLGASLWGLDLESETVFVGDEGTTEASGRTRRVGTDVEVRQRLLPWLWLDADVNVARGRFRDEPRGADRIPLAPTVTATAGLTVRDAGGAEGGLRARHVGARPATEDGSVRALGATVWELFAGVRVGRARVFGAIDNLFDATWNEAQFSTTSRLRDEAEPVTELHFTPGAPRGVQVGVEYRF